MADLSNVVEYERPHTIQMNHPVTGQPLGVSVNVVSSDSQRVVAAQRRSNADYWAALAAASDSDVKPEAPDNSRTILVACIDSWDWGEQSFGHIAGSGVPSQADKEFIIDHPNAVWFKNQLVAGCAKLENFTNPSPKSVPTGLKKK